MGKRVCCLYRVSTLKQVEKDDIPMQKQRCHEFAAQMGWDIVREFSEKGVSGFKASAKQRDAIQEIQREAALNAFDILYSCLTGWVTAMTKRPSSWNGLSITALRSGVPKKASRDLIPMWICLSSCSFQFAQVIGPVDKVAKRPILW